MTISKQAILGMIEIDKDVDKLSISEAAGTTTFSLTRNTYANIIDLVWDLNDNNSGSIIVYLDTDFHVYIDFIGEIITAIDDTVIRDILGGDYTITNGKVTFDNIPLYSWIPRYRSNDGNWFKQESESVVKGSIGVSGNLSGISYTVQQTQDFEWPFVLHDNAFAGSGTVNELRSFETVINSARSKVLQYTDSGNIYCKGVYYISSIDDYTGSTGALSGTWGNGIPNGETYVFCTAGKPNIQGQSDSTLNQYYNVNLMLTTGTAPSWDN